VTASALADQQGIATALRQAKPSGRHRKSSHASSWTMPRQQYSHTAAGRTTPRHRKPPQSAPAKAEPRHRKPPQSAPANSEPRHRKAGRGHNHGVNPSVRIGRDNPLRVATRRAAIPSALALGLLAVGGAISGSFSMPSIGANHAEDRSGGGMTHSAMPAPPALTALSAPSPAPTPWRAGRGVRGPVVGEGFAAWPIVQQAATDGGAGEPAPKGTTTTTVRDRAAQPAAFAPRVLAEPPSDARGGGGGAESTTPPEPRPAGGGSWPGLLPPGGDGGGDLWDRDPVDPNTGAPNDFGNRIPAARGNSGNGDDGADRPRGARDGSGPRDAGGAHNGHRRASDEGSSAGRGGDNRGNDHGGNGGRSGRGDGGGRGGGRH
jgi:hypothetical protein